jgi:hypothetical protein
MFGQLSTMFALLSAALFMANLAATTAAKDFDWDIQPNAGSPSVAFNNFTTSTEIVFMYDAPLLYENKTYRVVVFDADCKTIGSHEITHLEDASVDRELTVLLDVDQGTISNSTYYKSINMTNGVIGLCLRVDYLLNGASVNFHETNLTIDIDLTAGFNETTLEQMRIDAQQDTVNTNIDYPVVVYPCDESNDKLASKPALTQGDALQLCVELDPSTAINGNAYVVDILSVDLNQEKMDDNVTHKTIIDEAIPDSLTSKLCQGGICNVRTQLASSWFSDPDPGDINATGVAILAFGSVSSSSGQQRLRFLRAPIIFQQRKHADGSKLEMERKLQQGDDGNMFADFTLSTSLRIPSSSDDKAPAVILVSLALVLAVSLVSFCCCFIIRRCWQDEESEATGKSEVDPPDLESTSNDDDDLTEGS